MRKLKLLLCQLEDQKQAQFGNTFDNDEALNNNVCKIETSKKVECENKIKGKNPTNLKQYLRKYHINTYRKLLEKLKKRILRIIKLIVMVKTMSGN